MDALSLIHQRPHDNVVSERTADVAGIGCAPTDAIHTGEVRRIRPARNKSKLASPA
jgi:hypothetical protein